MAFDLGFIRTQKIPPKWDICLYNSYREVVNSSLTTSKKYNKFSQEAPKTQSPSHTVEAVRAMSDYRAPACKSEAIPPRPSETRPRWKQGGAPIKRDLGGQKTSLNVRLKLIKTESISSLMRSFLAYALKGSCVLNLSIPMKKGISDV